MRMNNCLAYSNYSYSWIRPKECALKNTIGLLYSGLPQSGKTLFFFFKVREKSGKFASSRGNSKFLVKVSEKSEFYFQVATSFDYDFFFMDKRQCPFKKYPLINAKKSVLTTCKWNWSKCKLKWIRFIHSITSCMVSENNVLWSVKSRGIFFILMGGNPDTVSWKEFSHNLPVLHYFFILENKKNTWMNSGKIGNFFVVFCLGDSTKPFIHM